MYSITCENLCVDFGTKVLFSGVSFALNEGDRVGIVGVNGAGKSTLLSILSGELSPTDGSVYIARGKSVGILRQHGAFEGSGTVFSEMLSAFPRLLYLEEEIGKLSLLLEGASAEERDGMIRAFSSYTEEFNENGGPSFRSRTRSMLLGVGFSEKDFDLSVSALSGGQKTRLALVRLLLSEPDILLLDEPTNHLDIDTLFWLEEYLCGYRKTVIVVSHDRYFLDRVTTRTLEIENGHAKLYDGAYSAYTEKKKKDREIAQRHYKNQQREIARIEAYIEQQRRWNRERNIIAAESRQKQLDKMERVEKPEDAPDSVRFRFTSSGTSGEDVLTIEHLSKAFPGHPLFSDCSALIKRGERVFLLGPNGCGKSTFLKILMSRIPPDRGTFTFGYRTTVGYYDQEQQQLTPENTVLDEVWNSYTSKNRTDIQCALARFLFRGEDVAKTVSVLSGGEKARLTLCKLLLSKMNVLILDEPTNHLDIPSREALEDALSEFDGTIIAVSHDRYFIEKLSTRIFDLSDHTLHDFRDGYDRYLAVKDAERAAASAGREQTVSDAKREHAQAKEEAAQKRKLTHARERVDREIAAAESEISKTDEQIASDKAAYDYVLLSELTDRKNALEERLWELYEESEHLSSLGY